LDSRRQFWQSGIGNITTPEYVIDMLKEYRKEQLAARLKIGDLWQKDDREKLGDAWIDPGWLFTTWDGYAMHTDTPTTWFPKFIEKYNKGIADREDLKPEEKEQLYLPKMMKFHALRHTSATLLLHAGINIKAVGSRLGHSQLSTTNRYLHALTSADKAATDTMQTVFKKSSSTKNQISAK
jgi:integrase